MTHVEDVKDPIEVLPPSRNRVFIDLPREESGHPTSFTLVGHLPLYLDYGPAIETSVREPLSVYELRFDLRGQLLDRHEHGPTQVIRSSPAQTPVEGLAYISASQAKVDMVLFICRGVLDKREPQVHRRVWGNVLLS